MVQHKAGTYAAAFTERYNIKQLVYFERFGTVTAAITREKQLKRWSRVKKISLIVGSNPDWADLSLEWGQPVAMFSGRPGTVTGFGDEIQGSLHYGASHLRSR